MLGTGVSAPHEQSDTFDQPDASRWTLVRGNMSFEKDHGSFGDTLSWLVVHDDDDAAGTGPSRVRVNETHTTGNETTWNTTSGSYFYSATLENDQTYTSPSAGTNYSFVGTGPASNTTSGTGDTTTGGQVIDDGNISLTISATQTEGIAPLGTTFGFDSTHANATNLSWVFDADGDGIDDANGTGFPAAASFSYATPGTYWARIHTAEGNDTGDAWIEIVVKREIIASFSVDETSPETGMGITFSSNSSEADAATLGWSMDLDGDGTSDANGTGLPASVLQTYAATGSYAATLTVTDGTYTSTSSLAITVTKALPPTGQSFGGAVGLTFGEDPAGGGYYTVGFTNERFFLGIPNATSGGFDIEVDEEGWGNVDPRKQNIDIRHKYAVEVDGTTVHVKVDNQPVGSYALPSVPKGAFGVITDEDMRMNVGEVHWQILDKTRPTVDIFRPRAGHVYIMDQIAVGYSEGSGPIFVQGPLTVGVDIEDDAGGIGLSSASLRLNGRSVDFTSTPGIDTSFTVDTTFLTPGYHTLTVRALDKQGNMEEDSVKIFVLGANVPNGHTVNSGVELVGDLVPELPPL